MGVAKRRWRACRVNLARDLGRADRVNLVSQPVETIAAGGIPASGARRLVARGRAVGWTPRRRSVASAVCFLFSDWRARITGEILTSSGFTRWARRFGERDDPAHRRDGFSGWSSLRDCSNATSARSCASCGRPTRRRAGAPRGDDRAPLRRPAARSGDRPRDPRRCHGRGLGLAPAGRRAILSEVTSIIHCAAAISFDQTSSRRASQHGGHLRVIELSREIAATGRLRRHVHVSTPTVAGLHKGLFRETDLDLGQSFRNTYEHSKFDAEVAIAAAPTASRS